MGETYMEVDGVVYSADMRELIRYPAEKQDKTFVVPDEVQKIRKEAFQSSHLRYIEGGRGLTEVEPAICSFQARSTLKGINIQSDFFTSVDGALYDKAMHTLIECPPGVFCDLESSPVKTIAKYALCMNRCISDVVLQDDVKTIEHGAFFLSSISSITGGFGLRSIGMSAFAQCEKLEMAVFQEGLKSIEVGAFNNSRNLKELLIPRSVSMIGFDRSWSTISKKTTILCEKGSYADTYAQKHDYRISYI